MTRSRYRARLERLEQQVSLPGSFLRAAAEIRALDREIEEADAEIEELAYRMAREELAQSRLEFDAFMRGLEGLSLSEQITKLDVEIAELEKQEDV